MVPETGSTAALRASRPHRDDGAGQDALDVGGDDVALMTDDGDQVLGVEAVGGAQCVSDHGQAGQGVDNLGEGRFHARSLTCGQDDDGGGARHVPPRGVCGPIGTGRSAPRIRT